MNRFWKQLIFIILGIVIITSGVLIVRAVNNRGNAPVAWWKFDEGYASTTYDAASSNDGTMYGGVQWKNEDECKTGKCLYFDGTDDYVLSNTDTTDSDNARTFEAWVRPMSFTSGSGGIVGAYSSNGSEYAGLVFYSSGTKLLHAVHTGAAYNSLEVSYTFSTGKWYHVASTWGSGGIKLYLNGTLIGSNAQTGTQWVGVSRFRVGYVGWPDGTFGALSYFNGLIDDVRIYDYARTPAQIKADYLASAGGRGASIKVGTSEEAQDASEGLIAHWNFDETSLNSCGTAQDACDSSGGGNHLAAQADAAPTSTAKFGYAATFDGTGDYYCSDPDDDGSCEDDDDLDITGDLTIAAWVKPKSGASEQIVSKDDSAGTRGYYLAISSSKLIFLISSDGSTLTYRIGASTLTVDGSTWIHVAGVFNSSAQTLDVYMNGEKDNGALTGSVPSSINATANSLIVGENSHSGNAFNGQIDDVKIYNKARTAAQIRKDYESGPPPVAHWKLDEKSGQYAYDTSGSNNGTLGADANVGTDDPTWKSAGHCKFGPCLSFDGTNDYVIVGAHSSLDTPGGITVEAWISPNSIASGERSIASKSYSTVWEFNQQGSSLRIKSTIGGTYYSSYLTGGDAMTVGSWYHVAYTYDRSTHTGRLYQNGVVKNSRTDVTGALGTSAAANLHIGARSSSPDLYFNGLIDDVRIYNYARTQKQIIQDMNAGHPAVGSPVGSYAAYWRFDEGYGSTTYDGSINSNDGTLTGGVQWTTNGKFGKALSFDGENDYVSCGTAGIPTSLPVTLSAWAYFDTDQAASDYDYVIQASDFSGSEDILAIAREATSNKVYYVEDNSVKLGPVISTGEWVHLAMVFNSSTPYVQFYMNGASETIAQPSSALSSAGAICEIGRLEFLDQHHIDGFIDEVKIYPFALTPEEIKQEYNRGSTLVLGASGTSDGAATSAYAALRKYCVPGDTSQCDPPVAHWKFDEKGGSTIYDTVGTNHGDLNLDGSPATTSAWKSAAHCHQGSCLSFDGVDDYVDCGSNINWSANQAKTVSVWIKTSTPGKTFINQDGEAIYLYLDSAGHLESWMNADVYDFGGNLADGVWHHVVWIYDGSAESAYLDGIQLGSSHTEAAPADSTAIHVGHRAGGAEYFNGLIDDIRIYNYARTPAQIAWDYNRGKPVAHWRMDENVSGDSQTLYDSSVHRNNGTTHWGANASGMDCTVAGKTNYGCDFDGTDDYVSISDSASIQPSSEFTITAWIYPEDVTNNKRIVAKWDGTGGGIDDGAIIFGTYDGANGGGLVLDICDSSDTFHATAASGDILTQNTWQFVAATFDSGAMATYLNGVRKTTGSLGETTIQDSSWDWGIGEETTPGVAEYFDGLIDEVKIYNYALTEEQVKMEYNAGAAIRFGPSSGLP